MLNVGPMEANLTVTARVRVGVCIHLRMWHMLYFMHVVMYDTDTYAYIKYMLHTCSRIYAHVYTHAYCILSFSNLLERNTMKGSMGTRRIFPVDEVF